MGLKIVGAKVDPLLIPLIDTIAKKENKTRSAFIRGLLIKVVEERL